MGLLGGTFDPPHVGHATVAEVARRQLDLDEVRFVVAGSPWMKSTTAPGEHRVELVRLVVNRNPSFAIDRREVDRDGPTYTVETLEQLRDEEPDVDWVFLLGADAAASLPEWHRGEEALALATFVVVTRPGSEAALDTAPFVVPERLPVPPVDVSSTEVRARFRDDRPVTHLVTPEVEGYVRRAGLYGATGGSER